MAKTFRPKEVLREAVQAKKEGNARVASKLYHTLALYLSKKEKYAEADQLIDEAIGLSKRSARLYVLKARIAFQLGYAEDWARALKAFVSYSTEKGQVREYMGYLEDQLPDLPKLRKHCFEELLKIERTTSFAFLGLARTCIEVKEFEQAKNVLIECLQTKDHIEKTLELLREVLVSMNSKHAIGYVEKYERGDLNLEELAALLGEKEKNKWLVTVSDVEGERDLKGLISDLEKELGIAVVEDIDSVKSLVHEFRHRAEEIVSKDSKARIDLALAFFEMGLNQDAVEELATIAVTDKLYPEALCLQGRVFIAQGQDIKALNNFQKTIRENRGGEEVVKDALYQMVEIYSRMSDFTKALETARRLEKLDPGYREIHRLRMNIEEQVGQ